MRYYTLAVSALVVFALGFLSGIAWYRHAERAIVANAPYAVSSGEAFRASNGYVLRGGELEEAKQNQHEIDKAVAETEYSLFHHVSKPSK